MPEHDRSTGERIIMMGCRGEGDGACGGALRFDSPNAAIKIFRSPEGWGRLTCIAMGKEKGAPVPSLVVVATGSGRERSVPTVNSDA